MLKNPCSSQATSKNIVRAIKLFHGQCFPSMYQSYQSYQVLAFFKLVVNFKLVIFNNNKKIVFLEKNSKFAYFCQILKFKKKLNETKEGRLDFKSSPKSCKSQITNSVSKSVTKEPNLLFLTQSDNTVLENDKGPCFA